MGTQASVWDEGGARRLACAPWELAWPGRWSGPRGEEERPAALHPLVLPGLPAAPHPGPRGPLRAHPGSVCAPAFSSSPRRRDQPCLSHGRPRERRVAVSLGDPLPCSWSGTEGPKGGRLRQSGAGTSAGDLPPPVPRATPPVPAPLFWRVLVLAETFHIQELTHSPNEQSCFLHCADL